MEHLYKIREKAMESLKELSRSPKLELMDEMDRKLVHELVEIVKGVDKICALEEDGHSQAGDWGGGRSGASYSSGSSYGDGYSGAHYVRGHMSRDGSYDGSYSGRRMSRDGARDAMTEGLRFAMSGAGSDRERQAIQRCLEEIGRN